MAALCANPRTLPIMDYYLARAKPLQKAGEDLCFDPWGRIVGTSRTATISTAGPPTTSLSRCEWLWQITESSDFKVSPETARTLGTFREFVWSQIWLK
jgi:hypothetical protein